MGCALELQKFTLGPLGCALELFWYFWTGKSMAWTSLRAYRISVWTQNGIFSISFDSFCQKPVFNHFSKAKSMAWTSLRASHISVWAQNNIFRFFDVVKKTELRDCWKSKSVAWTSLRAYHMSAWAQTGFFVFFYHVLPKNCVWGYSLLQVGFLGNRTHEKALNRIDGKLLWTKWYAQLDLQNSNLEPKFATSLIFMN